MAQFEVLRSALRGIANLQVLTYEYYWASKGENDDNEWVRDWQPGRIILSLLEFAGHSLVRLDLTRDGNDETLRAEEARARASIGFGMLGYQEERDHVYPGGKHSRVNLFIGSLRGFQVLELIRVQNEAFVEENIQGSVRSRRVHRLVDILPASVVEIELALPPLFTEDCYRMLEGLPELKAERVPQLKKITAQSDGPYTDMETVFKYHGIEFIELDD